VNGDGFLKGIQLSHCLDTIAEWHALVQGFCEAFCPWDCRRPFLDEDLATEIREKHHYYMAGRVLGFASLILFSVLAVALIHAIVA
jgi:hypothetical protein